MNEEKTLIQGENAVLMVKNEDSGELIEVGHVRKWSLALTYDYGAGFRYDGVTYTGPTYRYYRKLVFEGEPLDATIKVTKP